MPKINFHPPSFSEYVTENGIPGYTVHPRDPHESSFEISNDSGKRVATVFLSGSMTIEEPSAHEALVAVATQFETKYGLEHDKVDITCTYKRSDLPK